MVTLSSNIFRQKWSCILICHINRLSPGSFRERCLPRLWPSECPPCHLGTGMGSVSVAAHIFHYHAPLWENASICLACSSRARVPRPQWWYGGRDRSLTVCSFPSARKTGSWSKSIQYLTEENVTWAQLDPQVALESDPVTLSSFDNEARSWTIPCAWRCGSSLPSNVLCTVCACNATRPSSGAITMSVRRREACCDPRAPSSPFWYCHRARHWRTAAKWWDLEQQQQISSESCNPVRRMPRWLWRPWPRRVHAWRPWLGPAGGGG